MNRHAAISPGGTIVTGTAVETGERPSTLQFSDGFPTVVLGSAESDCVRNLDAREIDGLGLVVCWKSQGGMPWWLVRGQAPRQGPSVVHGDESPKIDPRGFLVWVDAADRGQSYLRLNLRTGEILPSEPMPPHRVGTSQGIAWIRDDGAIVWGDDQLHPGQVKGPRLWKLHVEVGPWVVGQTDRDWEVMAWHRDRDALYRVVRSSSSWRPRAAVVNGKLVVVMAQPFTVTREDQFVEVPVDAPTPDPGPGPGPAPIPVLDEWSHKLWVSSFFSYSERYGDTDDPIGNAETLVQDEQDPAVLPREIQRVQVLKRPLIVQGTDASGEGNINLTIAWWASGNSLATLSAAATACLQRPPAPVVAYLDARGWPAQAPAWMQSHRMWPSVQAYRFPGESLAAFEQAVEADLQRVTQWAPWLALTIRMDDFNSHSTAEAILECLPLYERWIRTYPVVVVHMFADRRGRGMAQIPQLRTWAHAVQAANPAERPSRWDYWTPGHVDPRFTAREKLKQTTPIIVVNEPERAELLAGLDALGGTPPAPPGPEPPPPPLPPPPPVPPGEAPDTEAITRRLGELRARYPPSMTQDQCVELLNAVAYEWRASGLGLLEKTEGNRGRRADDQECSVDYLVHQPSEQLADVLASAGPDGTTTPIRFTWRPMNLADGEHIGRFVAPIAGVPS